MNANDKEPLSECEALVENMIEDGIAECEEDGNTGPIEPVTFFVEMAARCMARAVLDCEVDLQLTLRIVKHRFVTILWELVG